MPERAIGPFNVSAISLGCMNLSHAYGVPPAPAEGERLLNRALDLGVTMLDTAALYGGGNNERLIASAIGHRRGEFTLASKCVLGMRRHQHTVSFSADELVRALGKRVVDKAAHAIDRLAVDHGAERRLALARVSHGHARHACCNRRGRTGRSRSTAPI